MRIEARLTRLEKTVAAKPVPCACGGRLVVFVRPGDEAKVPHTCPACGTPRRLIVIDEFDGEPVHAVANAA
ncbi:hypothetical protein PHYC_03827 [Phycisphaerales bacterium]|nr:hypothetical protein PHYC_03827 [Phycisphaerales bacterium]